MPSKLMQHVVDLLAERGARVEEIAELVHQIQSPYYNDLAMEQCLDAVNTVLGKREVQHAVLTGLVLDMLTEQGKVPEPLGSIIEKDDFLFGVDEILAVAITNVYGTIGLTNFGYLDKLKPGLIGRLDSANDRVNTFLDDLVSGIAAAAAARIAHQHGD